MNEHVFSPWVNKVLWALAVILGGAVFAGGLYVADQALQPVEYVQPSGEPFDGGRPVLEEP